MQQCLDCGGIMPIYRKPENETMVNATDNGNYNNLSEFMAVVDAWLIHHNIEFKWQGQHVSTRARQHTYTYTFSCSNESDAIFAALRWCN